MLNPPATSSLPAIANYYAPASLPSSTTTPSLPENPTTPVLHSKAIPAMPRNFSPEDTLEGKN